MKKYVVEFPGSKANEEVIADGYYVQAPTLQFYKDKKRDNKPGIIISIDEPDLVALYSLYNIVSVKEV